MRAGDLDVLFAVAGRSGSAHVLIAIAARANNWRIAQAAGNLPCKTAGGGHAGHLAFFIQHRTINCSSGRIQDFMDGVHAPVRSDPDILSHGIEALHILRLVFHIGICLQCCRRLPVRIVHVWPPPVLIGVCFLPQLPDLAGIFSQKIFFGQAHQQAEFGSAFTRQHYVSGVLHHGLGQCSHVLDIVHAAHRACATRGAMHAT